MSKFVTLFLVLVSFTLQINAQGWSSPYFEQPPFDVGNIEFVSRDPENRQVTIRMDEAIKSQDVLITILTYKGQNEPVPRFIEGTNETLGLFANRTGPGEKWDVWVNKTQDYEGDEIRRYDFFIDIQGETSGNIELLIRDNNDNKPQFDPSPMCTIRENYPVNAPTNCEYIVRDLDGISVDTIQFEVLPWTTNEFELVPLAYVGDNGLKTALVLKSPLDYEELMMHVLVLRATVDGFNSTDVGEVTVVINVEDIPDF